jgi:hypothetical protein
MTSSFVPTSTRTGDFAEEMASEPGTDTWDTLALKLSPNVTPDFAHPGGDGGLAVAVIIVCGVAAGIAFCVRLASRFVIRKVYIEDGKSVSSGHQRRYANRVAGLFFAASVWSMSIAE